MAALVYISILATSIYTLIACVKAISQLTLWIRRRRSVIFATRELSSSPSTPIEKASLPNDANDCDHNLFKASRADESEIIGCKDSSNREGLKGHPKESNGYLPPIKKADRKKPLEFPQADK